jgi:hypothetical protein
MMCDVDLIYIYFFFFFSKSPNDVNKFSVFDVRSSVQNNTIQIT